MKPFFLSLFMGLRDFFVYLWEDGNVFTAAIGVLAQIGAVVAYFFVSHFILRSIIIFVVGLILFYVGIIRWAKSQKKTKPIITRANGGWAAAASAKRK